MSLADDLLDTAKQHMRVTFTDDDDIIKRYIGAAVMNVESELGWSIEETTVDWTPVLIGNASRYPAPVLPVSSFVATVDSIDVSSQYRLEQHSRVTPVWLVRIDGSAFPAGISVKLTAGFTADKLPADVAMIILHITATYYEYRESVTAFGLDPMPHWLRELLDGLWVPRA